MYYNIDFYLHIIIILWCGYQKVDKQQQTLILHQLIIIFYYFQKFHKKKNKYIIFIRHW